MQKCRYGHAEGPFDKEDWFEIIGNDEDEYQPTKYEGWGKGSRDLVWERGLLSDEEIKRANKHGLAQAFLACADVQSQKSLLEKVVEA